MKKLLLIPVAIVLYLVAKQLYLEDKCFKHYAIGAKMTITESYCIRADGVPFPFDFYIKHVQPDVKYLRR